MSKHIGKYVRSVQEIAEELGCDWHTVNDTLLLYGEALIDNDPRARQTGRGPGPR